MIEQYLCVRNDTSSKRYITFVLFLVYTVDDWVLYKSQFNVSSDESID